PAGAEPVVEPDVRSTTGRCAGRERGEERDRMASAAGGRACHGIVRIEPRLPCALKNRPIRAGDCPSLALRVRGGDVNLFLIAAAQDATGLARGRYPAPSWVIWLLSAVVVVGAAVFLVLRARRGGRRP